MIEFLFLLAMSVTALYLGRSIYLTWKENKRWAFYKTHTLHDMTGHEFEKYVAWLLLQRGAHAKVTQKSGDFGADIILDWNGTTYSVQVKHRAKPVGVEAVSQAFGGKAYYHTDEAMVISSSSFTRAVVRHQKKSGVYLVDEKVLARWIFDLEEATSNERSS